jgi:hypothetical protein
MLGEVELEVGVEVEGEGLGVVIDYVSMYVN